MNDLSAYLTDRRREAEDQLREVLRPCAGLPEMLLEAMRYSVLAPGKRLRPILTVLAAEACAPAAGDPWPAACAVELVHVYSLIHDDLPAMDDDDLRRGLPTCHKRFGEAMAILAGDALQARAFELLAESYPASTAASCCLDLARAIGGAGMVGGQVDDLAMELAGADEVGDSVRTVEALQNLHARKTGALIRAALLLGVRAAHAGGLEPSRELLDRFDAYGRCLGLAFQITDDLLDVEGDAGQAGKRVRKDAARGKLTYPGLLGVGESRERAGRLGRAACEHLLPLGPAAARLRALVPFVLERDR